MDENSVGTSRSELLLQAANGLNTNASPAKDCQVPQRSMPPYRRLQMQRNNLDDRPSYNIRPFLFTTRGTAYWKWKSLDSASCPIRKEPSHSLASRSPNQTSKEAANTHTLITPPIRQRRVSAQVDIHLIRAGIPAPLVRGHIVARVRRQGFAVVPRRVRWAGVDDLDGDLLAVGFVADAVAGAAGGAGAGGGGVVA
ncbi:MAG: hypothetical protein L6R39_001206 [Caloplaca ligustica]|nr:MAG: hypothetical protein L6R39_001206 [Caloplaca ligustica]